MGSALVLLAAFSSALFTTKALFNVNGFGEGIEVYVDSAMELVTNYKMKITEKDYGEVFQAAQCCAVE